MSDLPFARDFRDLIVYRKAVEVESAIFEFSKSFPKEEKYSLTDQVRRSCRSIGAQIAEAWAKRRYTNHFISKLTDALAEQQESLHWLDCALRCNYMSPEDHTAISTKLDEVGRMISKANQFCQTDSRMVREESAEYFIAATTH